MDPRAQSPLVHVQQASPLDTLVRSASSRRTRNAQASTRQPVQLGVPETAPRQPASQEWAPPHSPLLHTQFRGSVASTTLSAYDQASYAASGHSSQLYDDTAHRDHLRGTRGASMASQYSYEAYDEMDGRMQPAYDGRGVSMGSQYSYDEITASYTDDRRNSSRTVERVPSVLVSSPEPPPVQSGRVPSKLPPGHSNFSRPAPPPRPSEDQKRHVLMRNAHSQSSTSLHEQTQVIPPPALSPPPTQPLPPVPGARAPSPQNSLYSSYSYYPYEAPLPSPGSPGQAPPMPSPTIAVRPPSPARNPSPAGDDPSADALKNPKTAQDFLQLGIQHHLANELAESAVCFEKSATIGGGCGMGMLMWGLAQRHGWGCEQSESRGFKWLQKAAEVALSDLEAERAAGIDKKAVKSEMVLAIYEVGQSFFRGWGVAKDKKMAVSFFRLASELGDPDAQQELAFCLLNGKGCKKDRKEAAKWYRAAVTQGASDVGLAWIYKEKFM
ncbi:hypothetical protein PsYK624_103450 [Phanerochaete sordida]|uniref:HCP-like protein n=1 Tax=Phanerochaete sordida TaxID=48140 RepID=A0A9P3GEF3_9APHY|nr:hypothetical protein PsYK624_103450 [Phanerochaete sordida]